MTPEGQVLVRRLVSGLSPGVRHGCLRGLEPSVVVIMCGTTMLLFSEYRVVLNR